ncbi:hypothetical protein KKD70_01860 [Patescibacteria group bacterium]|nr:hypothetical protein [Patescibacteria group bacterium]
MVDILRTSPRRTTSSHDGSNIDSSQECNLIQFPSTQETQTKPAAEITQFGLSLRTKLQKSLHIELAKATADHKYFTGLSQADALRHRKESRRSAESAAAKAANDLNSIKAQLDNFNTLYGEITLLD